MWKTIFALVVGAVFMGCAQHAAQQGAANSSYPGTNADFNSTFVRLQGRADPNATGGVLLAWPGAGVQVRTNGSSTITLTLAAHEHGEYNHVGVLVDGALQQQLNVSGTYGASPYTVAIPGGDHLVSVVKLTEPSSGDVLLSALSTDGQFESMPDPQRAIEVVGENMAAGYSVDGPAGATSGAGCQKDSYDASDYLANPNFQNIVDTFGMQLASTFNADWSILAYTGRGLLQNYDGSRGNCMPQLWTMGNPHDYTVGSAVRHVPDVVIINLGANDINYWLYNPNSSAPDAAGFTAAYLAFLQTIHSAYPQAQIVATAGPTLSDYQTLSNGQGLLTFASQTIRAAVKQATLQGIGVTFIALDTTPLADESCDYYPDATGHAAVTAQLVNTVSSIMGWQANSKGYSPVPLLPQGQGPKTITQTFATLADPLVNAGDPNVTGISQYEFPECHVCSPRPSAVVASCPNTVGISLPCQSYCHVPETLVEAYANNPPSSGNHYPTPEATLGEHLSPVARGHYIHSMEHGAVVIAYNCPSGCDSDLAQVRTVLKGELQGSDPTNPADTNNTWVILTPDPLLTGSQFVAMSWTWAYAFNTADVTALQCFIAQHKYFGRECSNGSSSERSSYLDGGCAPLLDQPMTTINP